MVAATQAAIRADSRVESLHDERPDGWFVNLAPGFEWSGQRAFGCETLAECARLLGDVQPIASDGPRLRFALVLSGKHATAPAPRVDAVDAECAGLFHAPSGRIVRPDYDQFRAALPPAVRRYVRTPADCSLWYDKRGRFEGGKTRGAMPHAHVYNARGDIVSTVYAMLCEETA